MIITINKTKYLTSEIVKTLERLTNHAIDNHIILKSSGKNVTVKFHDLDDDDYKKCTIKRGFIYSKIVSI